jgi:hypothetical protein
MEFNAFGHIFVFKASVMFWFNFNLKFVERDCFLGLQYQLCSSERSWLNPILIIYGIQYIIVFSLLKSLDYISSPHS